MAENKCYIQYSELDIFPRIVIVSTPELDGLFKDSVFHKDSDLFGTKFKEIAKEEYDILRKANSILTREGVPGFIRKDLVETVWHD